ILLDRLARAAEKLRAARLAGRQVPPIEELERLLERRAEEERVLLEEKVELALAEIERRLREVVDHVARATRDLIHRRGRLQEVLEGHDTEIGIALYLPRDDALVELVVPHLVLREHVDEPREEWVARLPRE